VISLQSTLRHQAVSGNQRLPVVYDSLNINNHGVYDSTPCC
jgi:hypothetical protein